MGGHNSIKDSLTTKATPNKFSVSCPGLGHISMWASISFPLHHQDWQLFKPQGGVTQALAVGRSATAVKL